MAHHIRVPLPNDASNTDRRETARLAALDRYAVLDTPPEADFDDIVRIAAQICGTPMALISLVDDRRQWFKAAVGLGVSETPRGIAFCAHAIEQDGLFIVGDASQDERFVGNPLVTGDSNLRFYAGAPLRTPDGFKLGTICVLDRTARRLLPDQLEALNALSRQVMAQLELRRMVRLRDSLLVEKDLLMQEVNHRVKNSLTMVQSLLTLQARAATDAVAADQLRESAGRIATFSAMHEHLYRVGADSQVDIAGYMRSLLEGHESALTGRGDRKIVFYGEPAFWPSAEAPMLGMIGLELATNALKYGVGTVTATLTHSENRAQLTVEDEGQSLPADFDPTRSKGMGMRIVTGLLGRQDDARLEIDRTRGHTCFIVRLTVPVAEV